MKVITLLFLIFIVSILVGAVQAQSLESQFQQQGISNPQVSTENGVVTITFDVDIEDMDSEKFLGQVTAIMQTVVEKYPEKSCATLLIHFSDGEIMEITGNPSDFRRGMTEEEFLTKADSIRFLTRGPPITPGPCNTENGMSCQSNPDECPCEPGYKCGPSDTRADEWGCVLEYIPKNAHIVGNKYICNRGYEWGPDGLDCIPTPTGIPTEITPSPTDPSTPPCTGTSTYAYIESRTMENEKEVRIPVMMCNANDLANMDFSVSYDPGVLDFKDAEKGSLNSNSLFESNEISSGNVKLSFASSKGVSGSGSIAILIFNVVGSNGDSSILTGSANTADTSSGSPIGLTINPGEFTVGGKKTIYVDDDFTDDPANHKWNTIQEGINDATDGDTVLVYNGRYTETVVLNKRLTLIGEGMPEIDAQSLGDAINIKADNCTVKGFNCVNAQPSPYAGIRVDSSNNVIVDNTCKDNYIGIYLLDSSNEIRNNAASSNNKYGIRVKASDGNIISNNTVKENGVDGIYLQVSNDNRIADNDVSNNEFYGIWVSSSNNNEVRNNVADSNHYYGIILRNSADNIIANNTAKENGNNGIYLLDSNDNRITDNDVSNNVKYYGIWVRSSNNNEVRNNVANSNYDGINLRKSTDNIIANNTCSSNSKCGISLTNSNNNRIYMNNFLDNDNNVYSYNSTNIWHSTSERTYRFKGNTHTNYLGNYWDDYTGSDTDNDGIGDISYNIYSDNNDNYPLKEPVENYFLPIRLEVVPILPIFFP